jgi:hypothetical protein
MVQLDRPQATELTGPARCAIVLCHLLAAAQRYPGLSFRHLFFLAPACTHEMFNREVAGHPNRYQQFRMLTMSDDFECKDRLVPGIYNRSLLYFISGVLEDEVDMPIAGLHRHTR